MTANTSKAPVESGDDVPAVTTSPKATSKGTRKPTDLLIVRLFLLVLGALLMGYAYLGRGFAHLGVPPLYLGEFVLGLGLAATVVAAVRSRLQISRSRLVVLLGIFMVLGLVRTVPYIQQYHMDALRDATVWGYAVFALMLFALLDRDWALRLFKLYGCAAVVFLFWGPVAYYLYVHYTGTVPGSFIYVSTLVPNAPGSDVPILFFKSQDMAVQTAGAIAFVVLVGAPEIRRALDFLWRFASALPAAWMVYITGSVSRGGLAAVGASMGVLALVAGRTRNWIPVASGAILMAALIVGGVTLPAFGPGPVSVATPAPVYPSVSSIAGATPTPTPVPTPTPTPVVDGSTVRDSTTTQLWENITSIFFGGGNVQLESTRSFRLEWWSKIIDYTFHGKYFWLGKGFGVNLATDDGFQQIGQDTLREPHNSHLSILARMGVPAFFLWLLLQGWFALALLRALLKYRHAGDKQMAAVAAWILVFWTAIMVNTSFDPYLEGPQGGIWFWSLFGLGLVLMRLVPKQQEE